MRMLFFSLCMFFMACAVCRDCDQNTVQKVYLQEPGQIVFSNSQIFIKLSEGYISVPAIYTDQSGVYVQRIWRKCAEGTWECPDCGRCTWNEETTCPMCGTAKP